LRLLEDSLDQQRGSIAAAVLPQPGSSTSAKPFHTAKRWVIAVAMLAACALFVDLRETLNILLRVPAYWLVFILALWTLDRVLMAWKWSFLLCGLNVQIPVSTLTRLYYQASFTGTFLPSSLGGDMVRAYWVGRASGATHQVYAAVIMEKAIGFLSALNCAAAGVLVFASLGIFVTAISSVALVLAGTLLLNAVFVFSLQPWCSRFFARTFAWIRWPKAHDFLNRVHEAYAQFKNCHRALLWNAVLTVFEHGLQMLIVLAMARSLDIRADAVLFLAITAVYLLIYRLPLSPDGWGIGEITALGLFGLIGVPPESGLALALLSHVLQTAVVLPGLWFLWRFGFAGSERSPAHQPGIS
jgi:uncharacterized protein (TIRG00374 family)